MNKNNTHFDTRYFNDNEETITKNTIIGAYFRYQRILQNISLSDAAKSMKMNKGFLSDLERGNRHFPEGTINQFNDFYLTNFQQNEKTYSQSYDLLNNAFLSYFQLNTALEKEYLTSYKSIPEKELHSYGFFTYKLVELFYQVRLANDSDIICQLISVLTNNLNVFSNEEKAIFFDICGEYYMQNYSTLFNAEECFKKSNSYCSKSSIIYALNIYQLFIIFEQTNRCAYALLNLPRVKDELKHTHSYARECILDIYSAKCLIQLGLNDIAQENLHVIQYSNISRIFYEDATIKRILHRALSFSYIQSQKYEEVLLLLQQETTPCWMIPYSLLQLNKHSQCQSYIKHNFQQVPNNEILLWKSIEALSKEDTSSACTYAQSFYLQQLENNHYEILHFLLDLLLTLTNNEDRNFYNILLDLNSLHNNNLSIKTSMLR